MWKILYIILLTNPTSSTYIQPHNKNIVAATHYVYLILGFGACVWKFPASLFGFLDYLRTHPSSSLSFFTLHSFVQQHQQQHSNPSIHTPHHSATHVLCSLGSSLVVCLLVCLVRCVYCLTLVRFDLVCSHLPTLAFTRTHTHTCLILCCVVFYEVHQFS